MRVRWDYDRFGNRKNQNVLAGSAPSPQLTISETSNRITSSGYTYDAWARLKTATAGSIGLNAFFWRAFAPLLALLALINLIGLVATRNRFHSPA